jgi:dTDP-4-dehydrorhamnose reductase
MGTSRQVNSKIKVLVTGASGFIGNQFMEAFRGHDVVGLRYSRSRPGLVALDLRDPLAVRACLEDLRPEVVIHCAARPRVDWCELNRDEARSINFLPVRLLAEECARLRAKLVFLSTDHVFDGLHGPYSETDPTNPINEYGRLKLEGERVITRLTNGHLIVRTTNVYGFDPESKNLLVAILPKLARGDRVRVANDQFGSPTLVQDLCSVVRDLIITGRTGTLHVAGPDLVNRAEWLRQAASTFGLDHTLVSGVLTGELDQPAPRPKRSGLISHRLPPLVTRRLTHLREGLAQTKKQWDEHRAKEVGAAVASCHGAVSA